MTHTADPTSLDALAADYWEAFLEANPLFATTLGDARFDGLLPDPTPEGLRAVRDRYAGLLARLEALPGPVPATPAAVTAATLRESLGADIATLDTGLLAWNVDPLDGLPAHLLQVPEYQRPTTPDGRDALLERWRAIGPHTDAHTATLRRSLADGLVASVTPVDRVIDVLGELLAQPEDAWPFLAPVAAHAHDRHEHEAHAAGSMTSAERERFAESLRAAVTDSIRPAFARLHDLLVTGIRPAARPAERPGLCHVAGGDAAYRNLVRVHTSLDLAPEELHATGLAEIERIDAEMEALAARAIGSRSRAEAVARLRGDPALHFATREEVHAKAVTSLARATEAIPAWFGRLPQAPCVVVDMPAHEEEHNTIAYYRHPAEDGSRPGQYYLNTSHPETRPRYEAEALAYHESIPGHHLQIAIAQELPGLPAFRRYLGPTALFEGWGLYTERLADEMGLYSGDLDRIGVLSFDAWRASRLVVDTGMHVLGWTRAQAIEFMSDHTALAANNIANEVDRYIVLPGQALAYKVGQLELLRLRATARERLGGAFDIRGFHDAVLGNGAIPLPVLRGVVEAWIGRRGGAPADALA